ncbi:hypothetical protein JQ633_05015 [Bradyrhizobium tropiciagri]|uniref:hypothetical protein n=1 Tax=Bradyrhizobium tropiciagri TaxID=312253 RepID=UPI001BA6D837|nr:hypothetical protein [Bradyrhizobium tropiciagri]MBR0869710.1 hypothetical protein [Bradyrhizobium tropiciagri]
MFEKKAAAEKIYPSATITVWAMFMSVNACACDKQFINHRDAMQREVEPGNFPRISPLQPDVF